MSQYENFERAFDNLQGLGRVWAAQGVDFGKAALQTGAERLKATAAYLEDLSQRMEAFKIQINAEPSEEPPAVEEPAAEEASN